MEEVSFARKYRPTKLSEYVGNEGIKDTLKRYLANKRPQTILLTGNTGCGKTTIARLIVKEYLCENRDNESGACCECFQCTAVDEYIKTGNTEYVNDVYEIDITDKSGKKDIDYVLETVEYPSITGGWKVYIFDEVHVASISAQSRMLKIAEEPPENVLMVFCTTNPEKMLDTLKNRCQLQLKVTKPGMSSLVKHLKRVCLNEGKESDTEGLRVIASRSDFVIRDAMNNLERVINSRGNAKIDSVSSEFKEISDNILFEFFKTFKEKDFLGYISLLYKIKVSYSFEQFLVSLSNFTIRGVYILNGVDVEGLSEEELSSYKNLFKEFSSQDISYILSSLKRMNVGDIEANLMSFIYTQEYGSKVRDIPSLSNESKPDVSKSGEASFRNQVLLKREKDKIKKGVDSLSGSMNEVGIQDLAGLFNFEKVSK